MNKKYTLFIILGSLLFLGAGCTLQVRTGAFDGGIFKSFDKGDTWFQKSDLVSVLGGKKFYTANINTIAFDPQDHRTLYAGGNNEGLLMSLDSGESWQRVDRFPAMKVNAIAIDNSNKCVLYATTENRALKTSDCGRSWNVMYTDGAPRATIRTIAIDAMRTNTIYLGMSDGRLIRSENGGIEWALIAEFRNAVRHIYAHPRNSQVLYVGLNDWGIRVSGDRGATWTDFSQALQKKTTSGSIVGIFPDQQNPLSFIFATTNELVRTDDGGRTFYPYTLLFKPRETVIYSIAVNPKNKNEIFYTVYKTLYRSIDGGKTWKSKSLPTRRFPTILEVDPENPNVLFMGVYQPE
ncbi:MAG: hypothetical protein HYW78_02615 [Parcubacteria group bacterium]|nr:hypothetical protein [Parcubacteria group bacterium]